MPPGDKKRGPTSPNFRFKFYYVFMVEHILRKKSNTAVAAYKWRGRQLLPSIHLNVIASPYIERLTPLSVNITGEKVVDLIKQHVQCFIKYKNILRTGNAYFAYACDCSLNVTLVLIIFDMISKYQLVLISSSFPQQNAFHKKMMMMIMTKRH